MFIKPKKKGWIGGSAAYYKVAGAAFTPASLSPALWLEPGKGGLFQSIAGTTPAVANADVVGFVPDQSTNGRTLTTTADDTTRPTLQGVGVFPYINFDGTNDLLRWLGDIGLYGAGSATWAFAIRSNSPATGKVLAAQRSTATTAPSFIVETDTTTATAASVFLRNDTPTIILGGGTPTAASVFDNTDRVFILTDDGSTLRTYLDGTAEATIGYTRSGTLTLNVFSLGASLSVSAGSWWPGRIYGAIFVPSAISLGNIASLTTYLGALQGRSL